MNFVDWGLSKIQTWVLSFLLDFLGALPNSPITAITSISGFELIAEYLPMINYFIPFNYCVSLVEGLCTAICAYYGGKFISGTLTLKDNALGGILKNLM